MRIRQWIIAVVVCLLSFAVLATERAEKAWALISNGAQVIDVRTPEEFGQGHLPMAVNIPLDTLPDAWQKIDKSIPVVLYCRSGHRAGIAETFLQGKGYTETLNGGGLEEMLNAK